MTKLVECVPNFSVGRDESVLEALAAAAGSVPGVTLLSYSGDPSHNRSVYTLVGGAEGVAEAAFLMCRVARDKIDLTSHAGAHPRMGAADVVPFIPLMETTMGECVELSKQVARRIWEELGIPTYLYEESASSPSRRDLAEIRRGQFEGMPAKMLLPEWAPDFGDKKVHLTAGVTAVGARPPLIAFNINLGTADLGIAKTIAKAVRAATGGYACCKALGVMLEERGVAQVSINFVDYRKTPIHRVFETVRAEAARYGVNIIGSELVGLAPAKALVDCAEYFLRLEDFDFQKQVLENHLIK
ncbi:MAG: glutamate formimidoyltransferase [Deltaproteobacteria bacterium]|jgi:glutamate formiminotransferase|nr:glutamate formimidoyltransferase [Deltaproteobacteria bacterium]